MSRVLTCVYCGHEYPQDTPAAGSAVLTEHIRNCAEHPLRAVSEQNARLRTELSYLCRVLAGTEAALRAYLPGGETAPHTAESAADTCALARRRATEVINACTHA